MPTQNLAEPFRPDAVPESFMPPKLYRDLRKLVRSRQGLNDNAVSHRGRIPAILAKYPYMRPKGGMYAGWCVRTSPN